MRNRPFSYRITLEADAMAEFDQHVVRRLSSMKGQFLDEQAYSAMLAQGDPLLYEVYYVERPEIAGELITGLSIVHAGKVGDEYFMTKGHFHAVLETAEIYYTLRGEGLMLMESPEGDWAAEELRPGRVLYIPPRWAHRSINTASQQDLVTFFVYPGHAGHDYGTIEQRGFRKLVIEHDGRPSICDNPRWRPPEVKTGSVARGW